MGNACTAPDRQVKDPEIEALSVTPDTPTASQRNPHNIQHKIAGVPENKLLIQSRCIDQQLGKDGLSQKNIIEMLLLGAGESGKSTLFRQMKIIYTSGFTSTERINFRTIITISVLTAVQALIQSCEESIPKEFENECKSIMNASGQCTSELAESVSVVWNLSMVKKVFEERAKLKVPLVADSAGYFLDHINRITMPDYLPSDDDMILARLRTTGAVKETFVLDNKTFLMIDVGGQRSERRKWSHFFHNIAAVIFVTSLSEYDEYLFEDTSINRMKDSLDLFEEVVNSSVFSDKQVILLLNKADLLLSKLQKGTSPISDFFPEYKGEKDFNAAVQFFTSLFEARNCNKTRKLYSQATTATNRDNVNFVLNSIMKIVSKNVITKMACSGTEHE